MKRVIKASGKRKNDLYINVKVDVISNGHTNDEMNYKLELLKNRLYEFMRTQFHHSEIVVK